MAQNETVPVQADRPWEFAHDLWRLRTTPGRQFVEVTERVADSVGRSGVTHGMVIVHSLHTTAAVLINENEPLLLEDLDDMLARWAPEEACYRHDDFQVRTVNLTPDERENGHAHAQALLLHPSITLAVVDGAPRLGRWQRIFLVELDGPRSRTLGVTTMGLTGLPSGTRSVLRAVHR